MVLVAQGGRRGSFTGCPGGACVLLAVTRGSPHSGTQPHSCSGNHAQGVPALRSHRMAWVLRHLGSRARWRTCCTSTACTCARWGELATVSAAARRIASTYTRHMAAGRGESGLPHCTG